MNRTVALGAAWSASAIAAVGLGFLAVSLVDASAAPGNSPVAATSTASTSEGASPSSTSSPPPPASGEYATVAGTVYADCTGGSPLLAGAPAAGWWVDDSNKPGEIEFRSAGQKLEVHVSCVNGSPQFSDEGLRADDNSGSSHSSSSSSSAASSSSAGHTSGHDDSDNSGGDNSGRGSSGSGSDDG